jgi:hypothetical protein
MAIVFTNSGELIALKNILNHTQPQTLELRLFSNNKVPAKTDVTADYTEVSGYGYAAVTLTPNDFVYTPGDPSTAAFPQITFAFTGAAGAIYGYYVVQATSGLLIFANRFANAPITVLNNGDEIRILLTLSLNNP